MSFGTFQEKKTINWLKNLKFSKSNFTPTVQPRHDEPKFCQFTELDNLLKSYIEVIETTQTLTTDSYNVKQMKKILDTQW